MSDWYRLQDIERERRQQELRYQANEAEYRYWWDPSQGFWAWMRKQDEHRLWMSQQDARLVYESWLDQQAGDSRADEAPWYEPLSVRHAAALETQRAEAGQLHDDLVELELLSGYSTVANHSHGRLNREFMDEMLDIIAAARQQGQKHPLDELLNASGTDWQSRRADADVPTVQAGHLISRHSGREERFALEDSSYNQTSSNRGETQGYIFLKDALDIGGIPVERRTAEMLERTGVLPAGTVQAALAHPGWQDARRAQEEWYRGEEIERERRQQELRYQANEAEYRYWWDPIQGFWAWMRRQDEHRQWQSQQEAQRSFEEWRRQEPHARESSHSSQPGITHAGQALARDLLTHRDDVGRSHDDLLRLEDLK